MFRQMAEEAELTDWDRFALIEYSRLASAEEGRQTDDDEEEPEDEDPVSGDEGAVGGDEMIHWSGTQLVSEDGNIKLHEGAAEAQQSPRGAQENGLLVSTDLASQPGVSPNASPTSASDASTSDGEGEGPHRPHHQRRMARVFDEQGNNGTSHHAVVRSSSAGDGASPTSANGAPSASLADASLTTTVAPAMIGTSNDIHASSAAKAAGLDSGGAKVYGQLGDTTDSMVVELRAQAQALKHNLSPLWLALSQ